VPGGGQAQAEMLAELHILTERNYSATLAKAANDLANTSVFGRPKPSQGSSGLSSCGGTWILVEDRQPQVVALVCSGFPDLEYTALQMMANFEEKLRERGITLWLANLNPEALAVVERSPVGKSLSHKHMFFNLEQAVEASQAMQDGDAVS
jgi:hypothetical protein